jgi:hypothetical protein
MISSALKGCDAEVWNNFTEIKCVVFVFFK